MHQVVCYRSDPVRMAIVARSFGVVQFTGKRDQAIVCGIVDR